MLYTQSISALSVLQDLSQFEDRMFRGRILQEDLENGLGRPVGFKFLEDGIFFSYLVGLLASYCM